MNKKQLFGWITVGVITGSTIYAIYKYKKMEKNAEGEISLHEARDIVAHHESILELETKREEGMYEESESFDKMIDECREEADYNASFTRGTDEFVSTKDGDVKIKHLDEFVATTPDADLPYDPDSFHYSDVPDMTVPEAETMTEEDKILKYDPNSREALNQYIRMELSEWPAVSAPYRRMLDLFEIEFKPTNDGDIDLVTRIQDYKEEFFGPNSQWIEHITIADLILYYAKRSEFNCGGMISEWADKFLEASELLSPEPGHYSQDEAISLLVNHKFHNKRLNSFGLFGISGQAWQSAQQIAEMNFDRQITFEIEFNEMIKEIML